MSKNWNPEFDKKIKEQINSSIDNMFPSEYAKNKIDMKIKNIEREKGGYKMKISKKFKMTTIIALCILCLGVGAYAIGAKTGIISSSTSYYNYKKYEDLDKVEKKVGFDANIPEQLTEEFKFDGIIIVDVADTDDDGNTFNERKAIDVIYKNSNGDTIDLNVDKVSWEERNLYAEEYMQMREIKGHNVYYSKIDNLFVGDESQILPEEKERMKNDPFFNVAFGGPKQERETCTSNHLVFENQGLIYSLFTKDSISADDLFEIGNAFFK